MTAAPPHPSESPHYNAVPAWVAFAVVVTLEYLAISYSIDARDLLRPADLEAALSGVGDLAPLAFLFPAAVFLTGGASVRLRLRELSTYRREVQWTFIWGVTHLLLFGAIVAITLKIKHFDDGQVAAARACLLLWLTTFLTSLVALSLTLWNAAAMMNSLRGLRRELEVGLLVSGLSWVLGLLSRDLWEPLAWLTLELVHSILTVIASDPVASIEDSLVGTSRFFVEVAPICSGIEGIALMLTFVGAYLAIRRNELVWPRAFALLPLSAAFVWLLNVVRVTGLIAVGTWYSPEVALGGFHSKAGWVLFALSALGIVHFVQRGKYFQIPLNHQESEPATPRATGPTQERLRYSPERKLENQPTTNETTVSHEAGITAAYLAPMLAVLASKLITGLATSGFDYFYAVSVLAAAIALFKFRRYYPPLSWGKLWLPLAVGVCVGLLWIVGFSTPAGASSVKEGLATLPFPLAAAWIAVRAFGSVVTIPIVEELAFRGYLLRRFSSPEFEKVRYQHFSWLGLIASSLAFGALHSQLGLGVIAGFTFGLLTVIRGRLSDAILAHAAANACIVIYVVVTQEFSLIA